MSGGGPGFQGESRGSAEVLGRNTKKPEKTLWNCMASLVRSNIQDFVQEEVPVGQMAQGTPFRCLPWERRKKTSQVSNTPPKGRRICQDLWGCRGRDAMLARF